MKINDMRYVIEVSRWKSINKASKYLYINQQQLSRIIAAVEKDAQVNRTLMSQAADSMLEIKGVEASFVIARINENECGISARSKGVVNVQVIMEKMHGGGHFNAAALQRKDTSVKALKEELKKKIDEYIEENKEEKKDESNTAK